MRTLSPYLSLTCLSVGETRWQNGHWKSENSMRVTGADAGPSAGSVGASATVCRGAPNSTRTSGPDLRSSLSSACRAVASRCSVR